jgi:hypothetical protein
MMKTTGYKRITITASLEKHEEFVVANSSGHEFFVREVTYHPGDMAVGLRGFAKKKNGDRGFVERSGSMSIDDLCRSIGTGIHIVAEILRKTGDLL